MPFPNAAYDTVLGQLQRGRGLGFLIAQDLPRSKARRLLTSCILDDPRMDIQCEERSKSYAELALKLDLDLDPLVQRLREVRGDEDQEYQSGLVNATLGAMAERGSTAAAEILLEVVRQAHRWDVCLDDLVSTGDAGLCVRLARIIESRFPTPESLRSALEWQYPEDPAWKRLVTLSDRIQDALQFCTDGRRRRSEERDERLVRLRTLRLRELIQHACTSDQHIPREIVRAVVRPQDTAYLQDEVIRWESNWAAYTALAALEAVAVPDISDWLIETMLRHPKSRRTNHWRFIQILLTLPAPVLLPLAIKYWTHVDPRLDRLSWQILAEHADRSDLPRLSARLPKLLEDECENHYAICEISRAIGRSPDVGPIPELQSAYERVEHSCSRWYIVPALRRTDPDGFRKTYATECLWDCEARVRDEAVEAASLTAPGVANRLVDLAADPFESPDLRDLARKRLGQTTA